MVIDTTGYGFYNSFLRFDDFAVTGLVYNDNVGVSAIELPDPIGIDDTVALSTTVINAGINNQTAGAAKLDPATTAAVPTPALVIKSRRFMFPPIK